MGGLGRGLAGILDQSPSGKAETLTEPSPGLGQLLGPQVSSKTAGVRAFVAETALAAVAEAFGADGVVMVSRDRATATSDVPPSLLPVEGRAGEAEHSNLAHRLPPSWGLNSPALFALYGNLWEMINSERHHCSQCGVSDQPLAYRQERLDSYWAWFCRIDDQATSVAAALIRATPFDDEESDALARSMRSVATAVAPASGRNINNIDTESTRVPVATNVVVTANLDTDDLANAITAEVTVRNSSGRTNGNGAKASTAVRNGVHSLDAARRARGSLASLTATGRGPDVETAVARAAANACHPQCHVRFAGSSDLDGNTVSIVIVSDSSGAPRLGVAVRPVGDYSGIAEAVFLAATPGGIPSVG